MLMKKLLNMEPKEVQHTYNWRSQVNYRLEMMKLGNQWTMSLKTEEIFPVKVRKTLPPKSGIDRVASHKACPK